MINAMILLMVKRLARSKLRSTNDNLFLVRITRTMFFIIGVYVLSIVIYDSGNLITRDAVIDRSTIAFVLLIVNTVAWYGASQNVGVHIKNLFVYMLSAILLAFAGFLTYWERGMASTSTILYVLPLLSIATLKNRHALLATAVLASGTYSFSAIKYFNDYFNEGYRIQLWGNLVLYVGAIFAVAWMIMVIAGLRHDSR